MVCEHWGLNIFCPVLQLNHPLVQPVAACAGPPSAASPAAPAGIAPLTGLSQSQGQQVVMPLEQALFLMEQAKQLQQQQQQGGPASFATPSQPHPRQQQPPTPQQPWPQPPGLTPAYSQPWGSEPQLATNPAFSPAHLAGPDSFGQPGCAGSSGGYGAPGAFSAPGSFEPPSHPRPHFGGQYGGMSSSQTQEGLQGTGFQQSAGSQWNQGQGHAGWPGSGFPAAGGIAPLGPGRHGSAGWSQQRGRNSRGRRGR